VTHASLIDFSVGLRARVRSVDLLEVQILRTKFSFRVMVIKIKTQDTVAYSAISFR
jgi:hypothetical protein